MDERQAKQIQKELDSELSGFSHGVAIMFGRDLWFDFLDRGLITQEIFGAEGTMLFSDTVPAYNKIHLAVLNTAIPTHEYRVGKRFFYS